MKIQCQEKQEYYKSQGWQTQKRKGKFYSILSFRCRKCKAVITYKLNDDQSLSLKKYRNNHSHPIQNKKAYKILTDQAIYENLHLNNKQLYDKVKSSYPMTKDRLLKSKKQILTLQSNFDKIKQLFTFLGYTCKYQHSESDSGKEDYPQTIVAVSLQHRNNYKKYGQSMSYDITYNCIHQKSFTGKKYGVGIFSGFDNNNRVLIFGLSITTYETIYDFKNVFNWFFDLMGFTQTNAIITDQQKSLILALEELKKEKKYKYHHIYDNWHFIKSVRHSLKNKLADLKIHELTTILNRMMKESDPLVGRRILQKIHIILLQNNLETQYNKLQSKIQNVCLWAMPHKFLGLSLHSNECINDLLKIKVEHQTSLYQLINKFQKVSKERNQKSESKSVYQNYRFQDFFDDKKVVQVREKFQKKVFNSFAHFYQKSLFFRLTKKSEEGSEFQIQHMDTGDKYTIGNWKCTCCASIKTGIPCEHIIYINRTQYPEQSYVDLFCERWFPKEQIKINHQVRGKRKISRRNTFR